MSLEGVWKQQPVCVSTDVWRRHLCTVVSCRDVTLSSMSWCKSHFLVFMIYDSSKILFLLKVFLSPINPEAEFLKLFLSFFAEFDQYKYHQRRWCLTSILDPASLKGPKLFYFPCAIKSQMQKRSVPAITQEGTAAAPVEVVCSSPTHISSLGASSLFLSCSCDRNLLA